MQNVMVVVGAGADSMCVEYLPAIHTPVIVRLQYFVVIWLAVDDLGRSD